MRHARALPTLAAVLAGPPAFVAASSWLFGSSPALGIQIALQLVYCGLAAAMVWIVTSVERLPLTSIGLRRPTVSTFLGGALLLFATLVVLPEITTPLVRMLGAGGLEEGLQRLAPLPMWFRLFIGVTGGIVEEILYRGYAVERLIAMTGRAWLAGAIAATAFGLAHIPWWGVGFSLGADLPFGIVMTAFYLWRRDLVANILAHSTGLALGLVSAAP